MFEQQTPMKKVVLELEKRGLNLNSMDALEVFGRTGDWHTMDYASHVSTLEVWEINANFLEDLKKNLPSAEIKMVDSFSEVKTTPNQYDLIVVDNPQSIYGECNKYCEHFELFPHVFRIANNPCVIIIDVNVEPYNLHRGLIWWKRRKAFYQTEFPERLSLEYVRRHYEKLCEQSGFSMEFSFSQKRNNFMHYFVFKIAVAS